MLYKYGKPARKKHIALVLLTVNLFHSFEFQTTEKSTRYPIGLYVSELNSPRQLLLTAYTVKSLRTVQLPISFER